MSQTTPPAPTDAPRAFTADSIPVYCAYDRMVPLGELTPNPDNPNKHPQAQVALLAGIIKGNGWRQAIVVSVQSGMITKGHGRLMAAKFGDMTEAPVDFQNYPSKEAEEADLLADNRIPELAIRDRSGELSMLNRLPAPDRLLAGYTAVDMALLATFASTPAGGAGAADPPPPAPSRVPDNPRAEPGRIYTLGRHRLVCGDATHGPTVTALMGKEKANAVICDPPYGVDFKRGEHIPDSKRSRHTNPDDMSITDDNRKGTDQGALTAALMGCAAKVARNGAAVYMFAANLEEGLHSLLGLKNAGWRIQSQLIWRKHHFVLGQADYQWTHEVLFYGYKPGKSHPWYGGRDKTTVIDCPRLMTTVHPNEKPVDLFTIFLGNSTIDGNIVYDPCAGSGACLMACERTNRTCYCVEIEPVWAHYAIARWCTETETDADKVFESAKNVPL